MVETLSCPSNSLLPYSCSWDQEQSLRQEQEWGSEKEKGEASPGETFPADHHLCGQSGLDPSGTFWGVTYTVAQHCPPEEWEVGGSIYSPAPVLIAFHILRSVHVQKLIRDPGIPDTAGETFKQKREVTRWGWNEGLPGHRQLLEAAAIVGVKDGPRWEVGTRSIQCSTIVRGQCEISFKNLNTPVLWSSVSTLQRTVSVLQRTKNTFRAVFIFMKE